MDNNKDEFEELKEKEEAEKNREKSVMDLLAMMAMASKAAEEKKKMENEVKYIGKVLYITYSGLVEAGFTPDQAMDLTKCLISEVSANNVLK